MLGARMGCLPKCPMAHFYVTLLHEACVRVCTYRYRYSLYRYKPAHCAGSLYRYSYSDPELADPDPGCSRGTVAPIAGCVSMSYVCAQAELQFTWAPSFLVAESDSAESAGPLGDALHAAADGLRSPWHFCAEIIWTGMPNQNFGSNQTTTLGPPQTSNGRPLQSH